MRQRPDSRHRLDGLRVNAVRRPGGPAADDRAAVGGWVPEDDDEVPLVPGRDPMHVDPDENTDDETDSEAPDVGRVGIERRPRRAGRRRSRLAQRWVPESLRDSRIDPGRRGALLLTVVAAVAALVAAVGVWRDRPEPRPVQAVALAQASTAATGLPMASAGSPRSTTKGTSRSVVTRETSGEAQSLVIVVSVTGAVRKPGLVHLSAGARVADAIEKAGGTTASANLTGLNLASKLTDGASVVVATGPDPPDGASSGSSVTGSDGGVDASPAVTAGAPTGKLDLNSADVTALDALPGVGPITAASIVAWRDKNGRFTSVEQLQEIQGIGPAKYAALAKLVTV